VYLIAGVNQSKLRKESFMKTTSVAIIGAGGMAEEHIKTFSSFDGVKVQGIYSRTRARAEKLSNIYSIPNVASSIENLYHQSKANLLIVAVPELAANLVAKAAFRFPWKVLMEKPVGYNLTDAQEILGYAQKNKTNVFVGMNRRFYSSSLTVKNELDLFDDNVRFIHIQDQQSISDAKSIGQPNKVAENYMYANSIHLIDLILYFCRGEITGVNNVMPWFGAETDRVLSLVEFSSGDKALYEGIWRGPGPWSCSVSTENKRWSMQPLETLEVQNLGERHRTFIEQSDNDKNFKPGFFLQAEAVLGAVSGDINESVKLEENIKTMHLIDRIFECRT
jgi:predicted dehydrogenase